MSDVGMRGGAIGPGGDAGPSRAYYYLAVIILVSGVVFFGLFLFKSIVAMKDGLAQVVVPGSRELVFDKTGDYTIFHEYRSVVEGKVYGSPPSLSGLDVMVRSVDSGEEVPLNPVGASMKYDIGSRSAYGLFSFQVDRPGTYEISAQYEDGREGDETVLAVGQGYLANLLITIFAAIGILFAAVAVSVLMVVITAVKRSRARQRSALPISSPPA